MADYMVEEDSGPRAIRYANLVVAIHWLSAVVQASYDSCHP